ncbi:5prime-3prime exoribonuclease 4 [Diplonema papillatum]|nr:5prime-3prime exoribonuclease 4 [Diplonema papillatum]
MGVPSFFKWMIHKYPKTLDPAMEAVQEMPADGSDPEPLDLNTPNPNGIEFDNLYLDMNGLVHPCCHHCDPLPENEEEMMLRIFESIDEVVAVVRPRKLLYMAVDGTAPRAKMNQQRARRFKSAQECRKDRQLEESLKQRLREAGFSVPASSASWDQNAITPGTPFMTRLSQACQWYVYERLNNDPYFSKIAIVYSDATVPGEGEHKIMNYIRACRTRPGYNPNTRHCIYGLDADLIMLALTTHEPYFSVVRDHIDWRNPQTKGRNKENSPPGLSNYDFLHCNVIREYLEADLAHLKARPLPMTYDFERCIDDFVFICFFAGNDFLPCLPSLQIREGGLDILIDFYAQNLEHIGGYITNHGEVSFPGLAMLLDVIGDKEDLIFAIRQERNEKIVKRNEFRTRSTRKRRTQDIRATYDAIEKKEGDPLDLYKKLTTLQKEEENDVEGLVEDSVQFGDPGYKERYYRSKFSDFYGDGHLRARMDASYHYLVGVQWVMRYYFQGTASWKWFYPFHYPPFASDLCVMAKSFASPPLIEIGVPFSAVTQLLGVMPPESKECLPKSAAWYMTSPQSPIKEMYPEVIEVDYEGKRFSWMGVVLLPFVDEVGLENAAKKVETNLTADETVRNTPGKDLIFAHIDTHVGQTIANAMRGVGDTGKESFLPGTEMAAKVKHHYPDNMYTMLEHYRQGYHAPTYRLESGTIVGRLQLAEEATPVDGTYKSPYKELGVDDIDNNKVVQAVFMLSEFYPHSSALLPDVLLPAPVLTEEDTLQKHSFVYDFIGAKGNDEPLIARAVRKNDFENGETFRGRPATPSTPGSNGGRSSYFDRQQSASPPPQSPGYPFAGGAPTDRAMAMQIGHAMRFDPLRMPGSNGKAGKKGGPYGGSPQQRGRGAGKGKNGFKGGGKGKG